MEVNAKPDAATTDAEVSEPTIEDSAAHTCAPVRCYTVSELATAAQVSRRMMGMAIKVVDNCVPEVANAVSAGKVSVSDAYKIYKYPHWLQRIALEKFLAGKCRRLADA